MQPEQGRGGRARLPTGTAEMSLERHRDKAFQLKGDVGTTTNGNKLAVN